MPRCVVAAFQARRSRLAEPHRHGAADAQSRCARPDVPSELAATYYRQRASAGLIVSEGTQISQQGQGYVWTPGLYTDKQVEGWRRATDAVHEAGGRIFAQLWHVGRVSHVSLQPNGGAPVAPSAIRANTRTFIDSGFAESPSRARSRRRRSPASSPISPTPRANAKRAGFDGVEIHGANGYLDRPVPARRRQQARRRLWRPGREPRPLRARDRRRARQGVAGDARRHPHRPDKPGQRRRRFQPGGDLRPSRRQTVGAQDRLHPCRRGRDPGRPQHRAVRLGGAAARLLRRLYRQQRLHARDGRSRRSPPATPTSSPSADRSSPIPIWSSACAAAPSSPPPTARRSSAAARRVTQTIRRSARRKPHQQRPSWPGLTRPSRLSGEVEGRRVYRPPLQDGWPGQARP